MSNKQKLIEDMKEGKLIYFKDADAAVKSTFIFDILYYVFCIISSWICLFVYIGGFHFGSVRKNCSF